MTKRDESRRSLDMSEKVKMKKVIVEIDITSFKLYTRVK